MMVGRMALLGCLSLIPVVMAGPRVQVLEDFEGTAPLKRWQISDNPAPDWDTEQTRMTVSEEWSDQGKRSGKIEFGKMRPDGGAWRVVRLPMSHVQATDWSGYDTLEFSLKYVGKRPLRGGADGMHVGFTCQNYFLSMRDDGMRPGINRYILEIDRIREKGADVSRMNRFQFHWRCPMDDLVFYIDSIRLVDYTSARRRALRQRLTEARRVFPGLALWGDLLKTVDQAERKELKAMGRQCQEAVGQILAERTGKLTVAERSMLVSLLTPLPMQDLPDSWDDASSRKRDMNQVTSGQERLAELERELNDQRHYEAQVRQVPQAQQLIMGMATYPKTWYEDEIFTGKMTGGIELAGAGAETLPCQIMLIGRKDFKQVQVHVRLSGKGGVLPASAIEVAPMGWRQDITRKKLFADVLRPDIREFPLKKGWRQPVWINLTLPHGFPSGDYKGDIVALADGHRFSVPLTVHVYDFSLPKDTADFSLKSAANNAVKRPDTDYDYMNRHRFIPGNIYSDHNGLPTNLDEMKKAREQGITFFNIYRFSDQGRGAFHGKSYSGMRYRIYTKRVDDWLKASVKSEKDWDFILKNCFLYTFDEPDPQWRFALEELCGKLKKKYRNIRTVAALNSYYEPPLKNLDVIVGTPHYLNMYRKQLPEAVRQGTEFWWYNIFISHTNAAILRGQFWATFLNPHLTGVLFYSIGDTSRTVYGPDLFFPATITDNHVSIIRRNRDKAPLSTLTMEYWREGMQDYEYLTILRRNNARLKAKGGNPELVREVEEFLQLKGIAIDLLDTTLVQKREVTVAMSGVATDMAVFSRAKAQAADYIQRIKRLLAE